MKNLILIFLLLLSLPALADEKPTYKTKRYRELHGMGLKRASDFSDFIKKYAVHDRHLQDTPLPASVDLSSKVSPPENQGGCGSCWDFSLTKALRSAWMVVGKDPGTLAFNYLLNNCGPGPNMYGCGGGDIPAGKNFFDGHGPWLESQDPYTQRQGRCRTDLSVAATAKTMVQVGNQKPSFHELADALSGQHMLSVTVAVCGEWGSYSSGIFNNNQCGAGSINHMINLVGYNCETSVDSNGNCAWNGQGQPSKGDGYLIAMNNWGEGWGERGYMRTRWGMDAIANDAVYFTVDYNPPAPVNGGWTEWSSCQNGTESRTCTNPAPSNGGTVCVGPASQSCSLPSNGIPVWVWIVIGLGGLAIISLIVVVVQEKK